MLGPVVKMVVGVLSKTRRSNLIIIIIVVTRMLGKTLNFPKIFKLSYKDIIG